LAQLRYLAPYILIIAFQYVVAKDALNYATPAVVELTACALTFAVFFVLTRVRLILNGQTLIFSFFFWASGAGWIYGLEYISSSQSAILSFTMPLFAIPLSVYLLGERSSRMEVYGGVVGFAGVILFNVPFLDGGLEVLGIALALGGAFLWALFSVYLKRLSSQDSLQTLSTGFLCCTILWAVVAVADFGARPSLNLGFDVGYLGIASGVVALYLWSALLRSERVTKLTVLIFVTPVITLVYGVVTTGVVPSYLTLAGVVLIFVGIYASNILGHRGEGSESSQRPVEPIVASGPPPDQHPS
jgi:drug/metabolite transporter (DMT)-like permease